MRRWTVPLAVALVATFAAVPAAGAAATPSTVHAAYSCVVDSYATVSGADWLRVHSSASLTSPVVGQVPYGSRWHYCSSSEHTSGGHTWLYGYGYNGTVKVTGWVVCDYF